ncbi:hypothetical protein KIPB_008507 [Kipferlia bialata]|uniref:Uncharacterized protein n=1 Tax=Kipferlia bialata TaxID=797122 RepID=A0A391NNA8_9EUKA|nr:hypothetical protein KIPB_008507 [Kipferlia bialata]|eukprot:g8507.t1
MPKLEFRPVYRQPRTPLTRSSHGMTYTQSPRRGRARSVSPMRLASQLTDGGLKQRMLGYATTECGDSSDFPGSHSVSLRGEIKRRYKDGKRKRETDNPDMVRVPWPESPRRITDEVALARLQSEHPTRKPSPFYIAASPRKAHQAVSRLPGHSPGGMAPGQSARKGRGPGLASKNCLDLTLPASKRTIALEPFAPTSSIAHPPHLDTVPMASRGSRRRVQELGREEYDSRYVVSLNEVEARRASSNGKDRELTVGELNRFARANGDYVRENGGYISVL